MGISHRSRLSRSATAVSVLSLVSLVVGAAGPVAAEEPLGLARLGEYFEQHPELKETKSSGWKPYNRELWFQSTRTAPAGVSAAALRLEYFAAAKQQLARGTDPNWFAIGPVEYSGRCLAVDFDPTNADVVYVGSAGGGLWKSLDGGDTWSTTTDDLPTLAVGAVCVLNADPNVVLMGTGEGNGVGFVASGKGIFGVGLLRSTDAGATWIQTSLSYAIPSNHGFNMIEDNPLTGTILAGTNDGLWRSTDQGDTWTQVLSGGNYMDVKWQPGSASRVYVTKCRDPFTNSQTTNGVYVSTDDGLTFNLAGTGQPNPATIAQTRLAVTPANPNYIYAHYIASGSWGTIGIYRSTDAGATWQVRNTGTNMGGGQGWYNNVLAADPNDAERVIAGGTALYVSSNGASNFVNLNSGAPFGDEISPHWDNHGLVYEPGSTSTVWITTDGGPWHSTDDGDTWAPRRAGIVTYQFYDIGVAQSDPLFIMGGTQDNGMPGRLDEDSWFHSTFIADGFVHNIDPANADIVYSEWQGGRHIKSTDGGQNWNNIQTGIFGAGAWLTPVDQDQAAGSHLYTSTTSGVFRTTTGGNSWANVGFQTASWISMNPSDGNVVWTVSNAAGVYVTTNDGASWIQSASFPGTGNAIKIQADPSNLDGAFVVFGGYGTGGPHIVRTTDRGISWTDVTGDYPDQPANTLIVDPAFPNHWYVGSDIGVFRTTDGGATWLPFGAGLVNAVVVDLEIRRDARKLVAGTYGRAVWEIDLTPNSAAIDPSETRSRQLLLDAPFPSPVQQQTTFRFAASGTTPARLEIFDLAGRRVAPIAEAIPADGIIRMIEWSRGDLADGVYFARLSAGDQVATRKLLLRR
ncbi:MAG: T9SS type A sorting domain-containing protein [Candidatus Eisenbacteria bacterium]|nr:T9SS type A sorting domain-containing protein [Candidatus Eisenbacteria bacterium]